MLRLSPHGEIAIPMRPIKEERCTLSRGRNTAVASAGRCSKKRAPSAERADQNGGAGGSRQPIGNFVAGVNRGRHRATSAAATRPRDLDSVSGVLFIDRHEECDLPMRRQLKHRVQSFALVPCARTRHVVNPGPSPTKVVPGGREFSALRMRATLSVRPVASKRSAP
jgi:hypothetical protein